MYLSPSVFRGAAAALLMSVTAFGQNSDTSSKPVPPPPPPARNGQVQAEEKAQDEETKTTNDPFAQKDQDSGDEKATPKKGKLTFPAGGFTGKGLRIQPPPMQANQQAQDANAAQRGAQGQGFNNNAVGPVANQPPVYLPNYNQNRPYGYPYYNYGYRYPGYFYPGYGYGYGYGIGNGIGHGVLQPGIGGSATGGSNFFGNPHGSQHFGNPHASQGR